MQSIQGPTKLTVSSEESGLRLDVWLTRRLPSLSRSRVQSLIRDGSISIEGEPARAHTKVTAGLTACVEIPAPEPTELVPENIPLDIVYEDADIIVVNKPAGLVVHPAAGHASGTMVNALLYHCDDLAGIGGEIRPGIVHRLDRDTSGVMVAAKNEIAMGNLVQQFKSGGVHKEYLAVVYGVPQPARGTISTLIGRSRHDRKKMSAHPPSGRPALTRYAVEESFNGFSLVRVTIETGRTHQIRVHMSHLGHPVVGDRQYGARKARAVLPVPVRRQMLHSCSLAFIHPRSGKPVGFRAQLPEDMDVLLDALRQQESRR